MDNPYEAPQTDNFAVRRYAWCVTIITLWVTSAAIGGALLGVAAHSIYKDSGLQQSPAWQVAAVFAVVCALLALPIGIQRTRLINEKLQDIYSRRQELEAALQDELRKRRPENS